MESCTLQGEQSEGKQRVKMKKGEPNEEEKEKRMQDVELVQGEEHQMKLGQGTDRKF